MQKRRIRNLLFLCLIVVLMALVTACDGGPETTLTNQQVVIIITQAAVPSINYYLEEKGQTPLGGIITASGDWDAVSVDDGLWEVTGPVVVVHPTPEKSCSTTWTFNEIDRSIKLVKCDCK
ncbi:hypothetical protein ACFLV5_02955 [Chloroflexota bacterium]